LIGDSGTGKSHLLIGLATAAAEAGFRVRYSLASKLVNELVEAADDKQLSKTIARYGRVDLLCLDELGYMELDRRGAELLFQVLTEREERSAVAIASNEPFSGWTKTFTDPRLCAAIVDRLTVAGRIIEPAPSPTGSHTLAWPRHGPNSAVQREHVGMRIELTLDCVELEVTAAFWQAALGYVRENTIENRYVTPLPNAYTSGVAPVAPCIP
jgi:hypothetical protein